MGQLMGVKTPPKSHGVLCFKVRYLKNYNQYRCNFWQISYGQKTQPSYGKSLCASFKKWLSKVRVFGRPRLNWHSVIDNFDVTLCSIRIVPWYPQLLINCAILHLKLKLFIYAISIYFIWRFYTLYNIVLHMHCQHIMCSFSPPTLFFFQ
jgi:hypothetical protein